MPPFFTRSRCSRIQYLRVDRIVPMGRQIFIVPEILETFESSTHIRTYLCTWEERRWCLLLPCVCGRRGISAIPNLFFPNNLRRSGIPPFQIGREGFLLGLESDGKNEMFSFTVYFIRCFFLHSNKDCHCKLKIYSLFT